MVYKNIVLVVELVFNLFTMHTWSGQQRIMYYNNKDMRTIKLQICVLVHHIRRKN